MENHRGDSPLLSDITGAMPLRGMYSYCTVLFGCHGRNKGIQLLLGIVLCNLTASDLGGDCACIRPVPCAEGAVDRLCHTGCIGLVDKYGCERVSQNFLTGSCCLVGGNLLRQLVAQDLVLFVSDKCRKTELPPPYSWTVRLRRLPWSRRSLTADSPCRRD